MKAGVFRQARLLCWLLLPGALLLTGCEGPYNTFDPAGPEARTLASLGWWLSLFMLAVVLIMTGLIVWAALRRRGNMESHMPVDAGGGKQWILLGGVLVSCTVLVILFFITLWVLNPLGQEDRPVDLELEVTGHLWWWEVKYVNAKDPVSEFVTANEIHIPTDARVRITLLSADVIHSFWVPRLHGKLDMIPGVENSLILEADKAGVYRGQCAEYCGLQHTHMRFLVIAQSPQEYRRWADRQRRPAQQPTNPQLTLGKQVFEQHACATCHTVRGSQADGEAGPDLTHFGSRLTLGAGLLPNERAHLQAWIVNAPSLKPGVKMPESKQLDGESLNALTLYLESLQ